MGRPIIVSQTECAAGSRHRSGPGHPLHGHLRGRSVPPEAPRPTLQTKPPQAGSADADPPRRLNVLVAEDDEAIRLLIEQLMVERGHHVEAVDRAEAALELCAPKLPDLAVIDLRLPGMDGLELCGQLRALPGGEECVIMVVTARGGDALSAILDAGADDYVAKPFDLDTLQVRLAVAERRVAGLAARRSAEQALRESEERYRAVVEQSTDAIVIAEGDRIVFANRAYAQMVGADATEVIGGAIDAFVAPVDRTLLRAHTRARQAGEPTPRQYEVRYQAPDGGLRTAEISATRITHRGRSASLAVIRDVTERKELEAALARSEPLRVLGQMTGGVAHDLNQSLALVLAYAELARRELADEPPDLRAALAMLGTVVEAAEHGGRTVQRLLAFGRGSEAIAPETVDVGTLLHEVAHLTAPIWRDAAQAEGRPIALSVETGPTVATVGHASALRAAVTNLVLNAVDALPEGGAIRLSARRRGDQVELVVADDGTGMTPDVQARAFQPFFTTKAERGTGLGLAQVAGVLEGLGGWIDLVSAPGRGTTFRLVFPAASPEPPGEGAKPSEAVRRGRVLVVDDEEALLQAGGRLLARAGHEVVTARSGEEALALMAADHFDVVVTDLSMGAGINGWRFAAAVRERWPATRVVLATGWGATIEPATARARGVHAVLSKPYRVSELVGTVASVLG